MVNSRKGQKSLWVDETFLKWLKNLKAKKQLEGEEIKNLGELTKQIVGTEAIIDVEKQVLDGRRLTNIKIKLDAKRIFK